ncbi:hypothetical protein KP509_26G047400 [Ceratopteris richardii]|uniref:Protein SCAI n=1 Tax=Ceratopteris richardii TaxID=49495 RepID=A0A8T2RNF1_CERRI|nr:hypothetical protein KP509_26G047400 [Ceratopteris richardii]KAH7296984.1 hypothetical protein KP509_26G047400 [Ceratopteris richardii]
MPSSECSFWELHSKADKKFSRLRDLPLYGTHRWDFFFDKAFQIYTKLWKTQQEQRQALVEAGLRRWQIGEIASRIGQLHYNYYIRTSDATFLSESYIFYEAIVSREYFKDAGKDATLINKQLRFYVRFIVVCLLLNRKEMASQLNWQLRALIDEFRGTLQGNDAKEWKRIGHDISRFIRADAVSQNSRPLRLSVLLDPQATCFPSTSRLGGHNPLNLKDALLVSYHYNEVKASDLTLDTFRFLQCLEWEPSGTFYRARTTESNGNTPMRTDDIIDHSLPPNPHKYVLHRPNILRFLLILASACDELPADGIVLLYLSASADGESLKNGTAQSSVDIRASASTHTPSLNLDSSTTASDLDEGIPETNKSLTSDTSDHVTTVGGESVNLDISDSNSGIWFGSREGAGARFLHPADLLPFTRAPLFIIVDSDKSNLFETIHGEEKGEPSALLLSPILQPQAENGEQQDSVAGSLFTFFLTTPLLAFFRLVNVSPITAAQAIHDQLEALMTSLTLEWGKLLSTSSLDYVWARIMWDPFLRRLLIRFIFCRACLALHTGYGSKIKSLPRCLPALPKEMLPTEVAIERYIYQIASCLGVLEQFKFSPEVDKVK